LDQPNEAKFKVSNNRGTLFVVATPIGNLDDISARATRVLTEVDLIAAEDTRHTRRLLAHLGIHTATCAYHDHNESRAAPGMIAKLLRGEDIALVSDAGTPLISDPGFRLVQQAHENGIRVVPVPGPSALISALCAAGLPGDRFVFEGYAPARATARRKRFRMLRDEPGTVVLFEAPHRILACLDDAAAEFGADRRAALARELSKRFETIRRDTLGGLRAWLRADEMQQRGEFVVLIEGTGGEPAGANMDPARVLDILLRKLPLKEAAALASEITGAGKNALYREGLKRRRD
jgi:16S rRNA (cytidine1402-2'-O)-methyltransferase